MRYILPDGRRPAQFSYRNDVAVPVDSFVPPDAAGLCEARFTAVWRG